MSRINRFTKADRREDLWLDAIRVITQGALSSDSLHGKGTRKGLQKIVFEVLDPTVLLHKYNSNSKNITFSKTNIQKALVDMIFITLK